VRALLEEAGLVHDQDGLIRTDLFDHVPAQVVSDGIGIPIRRIQEPLHAIGCGLAKQFGQVPAVLALDGRKQALEIAEGTSAGLSPSEARRDTAMELFQLIGPLLNRLHHVLALHSLKGSLHQVRL
jgi:hypothetical protein